MSFYDQETNTEETLILRRNIRFGNMPNNPLLLKYFIDKAPEKSASIVERRNYHEAQFRLLIDTIADDCVPGHWRCLCLDYTYLPLQALKVLANCSNSQKKLLALREELRVISHYFQASMTYTPKH